jgi:hypothetical protein
MQEDGFQEVRRRKQRATDETTGISMKAAVQNKTSPPPKEVVTRNFFTHLRAADMDTDSSGTETTSNEEAVPGKIVLTSTTDLIQLQKQRQSVIKENL